MPNPPERRRPENRIERLEWSTEQMAQRVARLVEAGMAVSLRASVALIGPRPQKSE